MAELALDTVLEAHVRLYDIDHAAAVRNAQIGARFAEVSKGATATRIMSTIPSSWIAAGVIVETNALFSSLGVTPLVAGRLSDQVHEIVADHVGR